MAGEGNFQRHAYLSMEAINFYLQFHFDLQRHLGTQFPLVSCCDLGIKILVSKKETIFSEQVILPSLSLFSSFPVLLEEENGLSSGSWNNFNS